MFISLDIETTGLQKDRDEIIEIGAARYDKEGNQIDTYQTFVKPRSPLPKLITHITGITEKDVETAPSLEDVTEAFTQYMKDDPIIGHNISFDTEFLAEKGIVLTGDLYDTLPLSSILLPGLPTYSLEMLTKRFNITHTDKHRALDDAIATADLFFMLKNKINEIDNKTLERMQDVVSRSQWPLKSLFTHAKPTTEKPSAETPVTVPSTIKLPFDEQEIISLYEEDGPLSKCEKHYEKRAPQIEMTRKIVECFSNKTHLLAEAGTGTGKSIAYLLPAAFKAREEKTKVVIATHTKHLQDQLYNKDVPIAQKTIAHYLKEDEDVRPFKATVLKGRKNYLSGKRLELLMEKSFLQDHEVTLILKVLLWRKKTMTGDMEELALRGKEYFAWNDICCDSAKCPHNDSEYASKCYLTRARERAGNADIIITNHALLLSDTTGPSSILPEYNYLIIDEAHHLEHEATSALSVILTAELMNKPLRKLRELLKPYHDYCEEIDTLRHKVEIFFGLLGMFYEKLSNYQNSIRNLTLHDQFFTSLEWKKVHESAENLTLIGEQLYRKLHAFTEEHEDEKRAAMVGLELVDLADIVKKINMMVIEKGVTDNGRNILWIYQKYDGNLGIKAAPLLVNEHLQGTLFHDKASIVLTSATLTIEKRFDYIRNQLGLDDRFEEALLPSHF
ncbi:DEAD/DEAH box helicase, partial [Candidatus Peregrinibacteria bacterium]|nr:DEAD/DEAH box helicase [Candidatus Peregrinibacteria bacterium]